MTKLSRDVWLRVAFVVASVPITFFVFISAESRLEAQLDAALLRLVVARRIPLRSGASLLLVPIGHHQSFWVVITPSCSALASILALASLGSMLPSVRRARHVVALAVAVGVVFLGNVVRIDASIFVGLIAGRASLVLFHDWVGATFGFAYVLGGYLLMLFISLPAPKRRPKNSSMAVPNIGRAISDEMSRPSAELLPVDGTARGASG